MTDPGREHLLFQLYGPLASWGDIAVGEVRPSFERPAKSAVLGLVAAALGIRRDEEETHLRLADDYGYAVQVSAFGRPLRDYHTVQRPPQRKGANYASRRQELAAVPRDALATTLSYRDYWQDAVYRVALWSWSDSPLHALDAVGAALKAPHFVLYLGRKSCPPALPLYPHVVQAGSAEEAFAAAAFPGETLLDAIAAGPATLYTEEELASGERLVRRDRTSSRRRWQFAERAEFRKVLPPKEANHV